MTSFQLCFVTFTSIEDITNIRIYLLRNRALFRRTDFKRVLMEKGAPALHSFRAAAITTDRQLTIIFGREWRKQWRPVGNASPGSGGNFSGRYATLVCGGGGGVCARWSELGRCTLRSSLQAALPHTLPPDGQKMHPQPRVVACPPPDGTYDWSSMVIISWGRSGSASRHSSVL